MREWSLQDQRKEKRQATGQPRKALAHMHVTNAHLLDPAFICFKVESVGWVGEADVWRKEG